MYYFVYGLIFIFFSTTIKVPMVDVNVQILPAFIGYALLIKPIKKYKHVETSLGEIESLSIVMAVFTFIEFVSTIIQYDIISQSQWITNILTPLTTLVVPLFITFRIVWSIRSIEERHKADWNTDALVQLWTYLLIVLLLNLFLNDSIFTIILNLASLVLKVWIIYNLVLTIKQATASEDEWFIAETKKPQAVE